MSAKRPTPITRLTSRKEEGMPERHLSVSEVAEILGTTERFPRRLIAERRIEYVKVGRHVRIPLSALSEYIDARTVQPLRPRLAVRRVA